MDRPPSSARRAPGLPLPVRTSDTLVFVPTFNEEATIGPLLDAFLDFPARPDVLVVDDHSTDGTSGLLVARASAEPRLTLIARPGKLGIGSAHKLAWLHARRLGYSRLVTLDADLSHDPADVQRLLAALDAGADVAIGSRYAAGGRLDYRGWRLFLSRSANGLARRLLRLPLTEYTTSLRAARLDRVPPGLVETIEDDGYSFFLTAAARFARQGLAVVEVPIHFRDRRHGRSKIHSLELVHGAANLLRLALERDQERGAVPDLPEADCPACGRPYRMRGASGELLCLACFGRGAEALS